ncbi:MAG TPA: hypothetical protein VEH06_17820, partial [Candidatus Bathyarchaeia archaeon]|nr:hypothetical protein [Candidatus Bathyarchaeia archaeon]
THHCFSYSGLTLFCCFRFFLNTILQRQGRKKRKEPKIRQPGNEIWMSEHQHTGEIHNICEKEYLIRI